jgi:hypothetical protein
MVDSGVHFDRVANLSEAASAFFRSRHRRVLSWLASRLSDKFLSLATFTNFKSMAILYKIKDRVNS